MMEKIRVEVAYDDWPNAGFEWMEEYFKENPGKVITGCKDVTTQDEIDDLNNSSMYYEVTIDLAPPSAGG